MVPTVKQVERAIRIPAKDWEGRCYEISCAIVASGLVKGTAVYGHYLGLVALESRFAYLENVGWVQHGWILRPQGSIVDATRWVFEACRPYIFCGESGHPDYDEGGNWLRMALLTPPPQQQGIPLVSLKFPVKTARFVRELLGAPRSRNGAVPVSLEEMAWLGNLPYQVLQPHAHTVYTALKDAGQQAIVPLDNRMRAERESGKLDVKR